MSCLGAGFLWVRRSAAGAAAAVVGGIHSTMTAAIHIDNERDLEPSANGLDESNRLYNKSLL